MTHDAYIQAKNNVFLTFLPLLAQLLQNIILYKQFGYMCNCVAADFLILKNRTTIFF